jgi:hypothetical protein
MRCSRARVPASPPPVVPQRYARAYMALSWGLPTASLIYFVAKLAVGESAMGNAGRPWCWIASVSDDTSWFMWGSMEQLLFYFMPLCVMFAYNCGVYVYLWRSLADVLADSAHPREGRIRARMLAYLAVFVFLAAWGLLNRVSAVRRARMRACVRVRVCVCA